MPVGLLRDRPDGRLLLRKFIAIELPRPRYDNGVTAASGGSLGKLAMTEAGTDISPYRHF